MANEIIVRKAKRHQKRQWKIIELKSSMNFIKCEFSSYSRFRFRQVDYLRNFNFNINWSTDNKPKQRWKKVDVPMFVCSSPSFPFLLSSSLSATTRRDNKVLKKQETKRATFLCFQCRTKKKRKDEKIAISFFLLPSSSPHSLDALHALSRKDCYCLANVKEKKHKRSSVSGFIAVFCRAQKSSMSNSTRSSLST